jgi:hypothetical protein
MWERLADVAANVILGVAILFVLMVFAYLAYRAARNVHALYRRCRRRVLRRRAEQRRQRLRVVNGGQR